MRDYQKELFNKTTNKSLFQMMNEKYPDGIIVAKLANTFHSNKNTTNNQTNDHQSENMFDQENSYLKNLTFPFINQQFKSYFNQFEENMDQNMQDQLVLKILQKIITKTSQNQADSLITSIYNKLNPYNYYNNSNPQNFNMESGNQQQDTYKTTNRKSFWLSNVVQEDLELNHNFDIHIDKILWNMEESVIIIFCDATYKIKAKDLQELNQFKDKLMNYVIHDLKNPLSGVINYINEIQSIISQNQQKQHNEKCQEVLKLIQKTKNQTEMLDLLIKDLTDYQLLKQQKLKVYPDEMHLNDIVFQCVEILQDKIVKKQNKVQVTYSPIEDDFLVSDPLRLKQIIMNLLSNSLKYTSKGCINIIVEQIEENNKDLLQVTVNDTGKGMSQQMCENLFQPFYSEDQNTNSYGVGIGLCICQSLIGFLGPDAKIDVKSQINHGSEFTFKIYKNIQQQDSNKWNNNQNNSLNNQTTINFLPSSNSQKYKFINNIKPIQTPSPSQWTRNIDYSQLNNQQSYSQFNQVLQPQQNFSYIQQSLVYNTDKQQFQPSYFKNVSKEQLSSRRLQQKKNSLNFNQQKKKNSINFSKDGQSEILSYYPNDDKIDKVMTQNNLNFENKIECCEVPSTDRQYLKQNNTYINSLLKYTNNDYAINFYCNNQNAENSKMQTNQIQTQQNKNSYSLTQPSPSQGYFSNDNNYNNEKNTKNNTISKITSVQNSTNKFFTSQSDNETQFPALKQLIKQKNSLKIRNSLNLNINNDNTQKLFKYINLFKNILLVDDDEFVLVGLKKILNQQHNKPYQIYEADDGETAIELAKKINFDLLIIDNQMQPLSGPQTAQQIKNIRPNCLIILSSSDELNDEFLQKLTYIDFIIHKPFTLKCFNEKLQSKLDPSVKI